MNETFENYLLEDLQPADFINVEIIEENIYKYQNNKLVDQFFSVKQFNIPKDDLEEQRNFLKVDEDLNFIQSYRYKPSTFLKYYGYYKDQDSNYYMVFDYFPRTLKKLLSEQDHPLEFSKLKTYYNFLLHGMVFLEVKDINIRDFQHDNVVVDAKGSLKIWNFSYKKQNLKINSQYYKQEIFFFALMILEMGTLKRVEFEKDLNSLSNEVSKILKELKINYNQLIGTEKKEFKNIYYALKRCIDFNSAESFDFVDLFKFAINENKLPFHILIEIIDFHDIKEFSDGKQGNDMKLKSHKNIKNDEEIKENDYKNQIEELKQENKLIRAKNKDFKKKIDESKHLNFDIKDQMEDNVISSQKVLEMQDKTIKMQDEKIAGLKKQIKEYEEKYGDLINQVVEWQNPEKRDPLQSDLIEIESSSSQNDVDLEEKLKEFYKNEEPPNEIIKEDKNEENKQVEQPKKKINLEFGSKCFTCDKELKPFDAQYYCYFCKLWFCEECGDKDDTTGEKKGSDRLIHPHNLVWINVLLDSGLKDIEEFRLGNNKIFNENIQTHKARCNFCEQSIIKSYRYLCLNCPQVGKAFTDICQKCMDCLRYKENNINEDIKVNNVIFKEEILSRMEDDGHEMESHIYLRICFGDCYWNY